VKLGGRYLAFAAGLLAACIPSLEGLSGGGDERDGATDTGMDAPTRDVRPDDSRSESAPSDVVHPDEAGDACSGDLSSDPKNCGTCGHDCLGGTCAMSACQPVVLATGQNDPLIVALDGSNVYWTTYGNLSGTDLGDVWECAKAGCAMSPKNLVPNANIPYGLSVVGATLYYDTYGANTVMSCTLPGCATPDMLASSTNGPNGLGATTTGVYWVDYLGNTLDSCALPGCGSGPTALATGLSSPGWLALDETSVYFTSTTTVESCSLAGCGGTPAVLWAGALDAEGVAVDATSIYWVDYMAGTVNSCPLAGCSGTTTVLAKNQSNPIDVAVDAASVYWVTSTTAGAVLRCPLAGCGGSGPVTMASGQSSPGALAVDDVAVYWVNDGAFGDGEGSVFKVAK
jgi:hypothetical protein